MQTVSAISQRNQVNAIPSVGKDSLSMAARVGDETVKSPGSLVISAYVGCEDIRKTVTPDFKCPGDTGKHVPGRFARPFIQINNRENNYF